jgi:predicted RNase H-like HicB family nuclease
MRTLKLTAIIEREGAEFVSLCPELDVASQGATVADARANLREAVMLFLEHASEQELQERLPSEVHVEPMEVTVA